MTAETSQRQRVASLVGITLSWLVGCRSAPSTPAPSVSETGISETSVASSASVGTAPTHEAAFERAQVVTSAAPPRPLTGPTSDVTSNGFGPSQAPSTDPLRIAFSRDPGFAQWDNVAKSGAFARRNLAVQLTAFGHAASLEAYGAGRADAVAATNAELLLARSLGSPCTAISVTWVAAQTQALYARRGIETVAALRGKSVGVELAQPEHLVLERALHAAGLRNGDVKLVNVVPEVAHREFASRPLDAVMLPYSVTERFENHVTVAHRVHAPALASPLLYGVLCVRADSLATRRAEWTQVVAAWGETISSSSEASVRLVGGSSLLPDVASATRELDAFYREHHVYEGVMFDQRDFLATD